MNKKPYIELLREYGMTEESSELDFDEILDQLRKEVTYEIIADFYDVESFGTDHTTENLDFYWTTKEGAEKAKKDLEEHLDYVKSRKYWRNNIDPKGKSWYCDSDTFDKFGEHTIKLSLDSGSIIQLYTPWTGHFASEVSFEIEETKLNIN